MAQHILLRIVEQKRLELARSSTSRAELGRQAEDNLNSHRDFAAAISSSPPAIIAEIKKASPSKGLLSKEFDPARLARAYEAGGAAALSVLTDRDFFQGSLADLGAARAAVGIPLLRKDFTIDEYHVVEAAASGADAVLLIAAILTRAQLEQYRRLAEQLKMAALVEVHNSEELDMALESEARIVGVNNRNLHSFEVSLDTSLDLADRIPAGVIKVSESGIHSREHVRILSAAGYQAFLVGEHLVTSGDPTQALLKLTE